MGALNRSAVALTLVTVAGASGPAFGQSSVTVAPSVAAGPVYDTNVFFTPTPEADLIWRLTCGLATEKMGPRSNFAAQYSFDAEQFRDHPSLSTPLAHQIGEARTQWRPSSAVTAAINGGYERTLHPADLNLTTGLAIGRLQAWRGSGGTDLKIRGGAHTEVGLGYQFTRDVVEAGGDVNTHAGRVEVTQETGVHDALHLKYLPQAFLFGAGGTVQQPDLVWHVVAVGWTHDVSKTTHLSVEAGPRIRPGQVEPYVLLSLEGKGRAAERSVVYTRTSTTAIGVIGPIEVQSILGSAGYNRPGAIDLRLAGGVYRNVINRDAILLFRMCCA
jgi:hypothetical protein